MISEELIVVTADNKRCCSCDMNLVGSVWNGVTVAIKTRKEFSRYHSNISTKFFCVRCMTKNTANHHHTRVKHARTPQQLDEFVDNVLSNRLN